jgi:hypothetical protein
MDAISLSGRPDAATYPQHVCAAGVELLGVSGAGLTLMAKTQLGAVWASDKSSQAVEDLQFALGEGPALDAFHLGAPAIEPDLATAPARWPFFGPRALDLGVRAVFSFPLQMGVIRLGALNLFRGSPGLLSVDQLGDSLVLADVATGDIIDLQEEGAIRWSRSDRLGQRARVHQATGMVAVQIDSDMGAALARIRAYAFANELSIFEVADQVIDRRLRLPPHALQ